MKKVIAGLGSIALWLAFSPVASAATCRVNGQVVDCPDFLGPLLAFFVIFYIVCFALGILVLVSMWKIFKKANKPGWAAIVPIYNVIVQLEIINRPLWWIILMFIPFVNIVISIIALNDLSKVFGKGGWFTVGLLFVPFIFYPILAFGDATYIDPHQQQPSYIPPQPPPMPPQPPVQPTTM